jgi:hypothetical protein
MSSRCAACAPTGALLVDVETRRPVDILPERSADSTREQVARAAALMGLAVAPAREHEH